MFILRAPKTLMIPGVQISTSSAVGFQKLCVVELKKKKLNRKFPKISDTRKYKIVMKTQLKFHSKHFLLFAVKEHNILP